MPRPEGPPAATPDPAPTARRAARKLQAASLRVGGARCPLLPRDALRALGQRALTAFLRYKRGSRDHTRFRRPLPCAVGGSRERRGSMTTTVSLPGAGCAPVLAFGARPGGQHPQVLLDDSRGDTVRALAGGPP